MLAMRHGNFSVSLLSNLIRNVRENNVSHNPIKIINVRAAFFNTKAFVYQSVAICLIMIKLLHHAV